MKKIKNIILLVCLVVFGLFITGCGCEKEKYVVSFDTLGGSHVTSQTIEKGEKVSVPSIPTRDGYIFSEWQLDGVKYDFSKGVTSNITLTASWVVDDRVQYTVKFDTKGGSALEDVMVREGDVLTSPADPTKEGFILEGWYLGKEIYDFTKPVTKDMTLVAIWKEVEEDQFVVTFNTDGGSTVKKQTVTAGNKVKKPTNPTKTGYKFVEWQLDGETFDFNTIIDEDVTLKAVWEKKAQYTVTFDTKGGSTVNSVKVYEGDKVSKPVIPTRKGYAFVEWQLDGKAYNFASPVTKDITLVAIWEEVVTGVSLSKTNLELTVGDDATLVATIEPSSLADKKITWSSDKTSVATVSQDGKVTAVGAGTAKITATVDGKTATCTVTVAKKITYEIEYKEASGTSLAQNYLFIKSSEDEYVAGVIEITTINDDVIEVEVTTNGSKEAYVKTIIKSAKVKSVK